MIIKPRRDTTANWSVANPILAEGELAAELMVGGVVKLKIGNGSTPWNDLGYASGGEKGDKGDKGDKGNTGNVGPSWAETVVTKGTTNESGILTAVLSTTTPPPPNRMYLIYNVGGTIVAGAAAGSITIKLMTANNSPWAGTSYPDGSVQYFNILLSNDSAEDLEVSITGVGDYATAQYLGPAPIITAGTVGLINFMVVMASGGGLSTMLFISNVGV